VSPYIGIPGAPAAPRCYYWLHTHDASGIIHVESPAQRVFTLGQLFDVWGQPLARTGVATYPTTDLTVLVDGQTWDGDPRDVVLGAHTQVVLELGRTVPAPELSFPPGF
jgi:hypothetical protein